ncbi:unnamed protein product [Dibothriocephalus latus]|uniref:Uncharacterized protein n=1 Tax=Dibothriocephalus latus TaxID=60516 RepID=A0A3P7MWD5_DIBLA|nr:unnamed protein product [Dibothriocephalus latus]
MLVENWALVSGRRHGWQNNRAGHEHKLVSCLVPTVEGPGNPASSTGRFVVGSSSLGILTFGSADNKNSALVHNLLSKPLAATHLAILQRGTTFNTGDASPAEFIAALKSALQSSNASEDTKESIRHKASSLLMQRNQCEALDREGQRALKSLKADEKIIILPADKCRSTAVLNKSD